MERRKEQVRMRLKAEQDSLSDHLSGAKKLNQSKLERVYRKIEVLERKLSMVEGERAVSFINL